MRIQGEYRNDVEIILLAQKRSGHHAIAQWLARLMDPPICFLNWVPAYTDPFLTFHDPFGFSKTIDRFMPLEDPEGVRRQRKNFLLIDYQDVPLHAFSDPSFIPDRVNSIGRSGKRHQVMILRDPFNCMASRLVRYRKVTRDPPPGVRPHEMVPDAAIVDQWCSYAREFLGTTNHLSNKVTINFNRWHSSSGYRAQICAVLELRADDHGTGTEVPTAGGGSSFDGLTFQGKAEQMDIANRWRQLAGDEEFRSLFQGREELFALSRQIFGDLPGTSELLRDQR
jgi:hypothetical protein